MVKVDKELVLVGRVALLNTARETAHGRAKEKAKICQAAVVAVTVAAVATAVAAATAEAVEAVVVPAVVV